MPRRAYDVAVAEADFALNPAPHSDPATSAATGARQPKATCKLAVGSVVFDARNKGAGSGVMAALNPERALIITAEMAADSKAAFSAGLAMATAVKGPIRPVTVRSKPINKPTLANDDR